LALVPAGTVGGVAFDAIRTISALFPFKATLQALDAGLNGAAPGLGAPLAHLAALTIGYLALARLALARFTG